MGVQPLGFGKKLPGAGDLYLRIKEKGDKVQFKIAQEPVYTGKHFIQTEQGWDVPECPRIVSGEECERCNRYFDLKSQAKKLKEVEPKKADALEKEARPFQATIEFYFPILDRADGKFKVLQTTNGVRNKFNEQFEAGTDVLDTEWLLANTGSASPSARYLLTPIDSSKVVPLTPEEEVEFEKAKKYDLSSISQGPKEDATLDDF